VVDVGLYEPMLRMLDELIPVYGARGYVRERIGSGTEYVVPHNHYRARDGRWLAIACTNDRMFGRLAAAMDRPELAAEYPTMAARLARRADLDAMVQTWVGAADARDVLARLDAAEVPCGPVASARDLFEDPHVRARENIVELPSPLGGVLAMVGVVPRLTESPGRVESVGPAAVGAHNEEIYCGRLGLTREELEALSARGVV
jgi:crotonobetainyl-CoA:carnitine CoA-transferase CaiB-like acyl-CoA transferase